MNSRGQVLSEASDRELVVAFQSGDRRAYDEIYRRHVPRVRRVCRRMLANAQDVDEATQETFIKAYQALGRFNGSYLLGPWLGRIAANVCVDHLRSESRSPCIAVGSDVESSETQCSPEDVLTGHDPRVNATIHRLRPLHARALELRAVHGLSHQEIAARLSMTPAQVKALLHRARESFRRAWDKAEGWVLAPLFGLRQLTSDNSAGSSVAALPTWGISTLAPTSAAVADKVTAAAVAAILAFAPFGISSSVTETEDAPATGSRATHPETVAQPIQQHEVEVKLASGRRTTYQVERPRGTRTTPDTGAAAAEHDPAPDEAPLLPAGVEPPEPPEPPQPPQPPGGRGERRGDEPPIGPSGAGNHIRRVYELADKALDSLPVTPGN